MPRLDLPRVVLVLTALLCAWLMAPMAQADDAALPPGHPPMGDGSSASGGLPPGHPPMGSGGGGGMPGGSGGMPAGHPSVGGMEPVSTAPFTGTFLLRVAQGTKDGAPVAGDTAVVSFYQGGQVLIKKETKLDDRGTVDLENLTIPGSGQPEVVVTHAGMTFRKFGPPLSAEQPDQVLRMTVYDAAEKAPAWELSMRHLMVVSTGHGIQVTEIWTVQCPGDRAWAGGDDKVSLRIALPAGATSVRVGQGFHPGYLKVEEGKILQQMPLTPGDTELRFAYVLPAQGDQSTLAITSPAATQHLSVIVAGTGGKVTAQGLSEAPAMDMGMGSVRVYEAQNVAAAAALSVALQGVAPPPAPSMPHSEADDQSDQRTAAGDASATPAMPAAAAAIPNPSSSMSPFRSLVAVGLGALLGYAGWMVLRGSQHKKPRANS